jgi:ATP-dependent DNA ligase
VDLPVMPPVAPMLAKSVKEVPAGPGYLYEPKWDGFRCIVFRDGDEVELGSRNERPMTRYFPEVVEAVKAQLPERCVVDGEIVIARGGRLDFEALLQRIHPADSRVRLLAEQTPASLLVFDLLAIGEEALVETPLAERRRRLDDALADVKPPVHRTSVTDDPAVAREWFATFEGAGLDGVVAKPVDGTYEQDKRVLLKVKHERTADCVVAGFRWHKASTPEAPLLGSLLLGLYGTEQGEPDRLQHVGVVASFPMARRAELVEELAPWRQDALDGHPWRDWAEAVSIPPEGATGGVRMPGAQSRWNAKKDLSWQPLRPERVVEVRYDHMEGTRFRHTTQFVRWRDDRDPRSCTYEQLEVPVTYDLGALLS